MTTVMFGPYATHTLAALGADVIKIEPVAGDEVRRVGRPTVTRGMGPCHLAINRGKRSVVWDLKSPWGRRALKILLGRADVFIHNLRPDAIAKLGLSYAEMAAVRPDIVYVACTGFGSGGAYAGLPAYDDIIQALSGAASLLPRADGNPAPRFLPTAMADKVSGLHAVYAVLAALLHRQRTGEGQEVEVPMFEVFTHFLLVEHLYGATFIPPNDPAGYPRQLDPHRHPMPTLDGYIAVAPYTDERWVRFFTVTGHASFLAQQGLATARQRHLASDQMHERMALILSEQTTAHWLDFLARHDIPAARINQIEDLFADPHLQQVGFFKRSRHPTEGDYHYADLPVRFGMPGAPLEPAPTLGQHSDAVLAELAVDPELLRDVR